MGICGAFGASVGRLRWGGVGSGSCGGVCVCWPVGRVALPVVEYVEV